MRSYTNRKGESVTVSKEHLDTAIEIKRELQNLSPSMRTSWARHKRMMTKEGFEDSCTSESYRCMIKNEQKKRGNLPDAVKHADIIATNKLEAIKQEVGEMAWRNREIQNESRKLGKIRRNLVDGTLFIEEVSQGIRDTLSEIDWYKLISAREDTVIRSGSKRMVLVVTDWHIGAVVDVNGNKFNFDIAKKRIEQLVNKVSEIAKINNVRQIDVVYCGDMTEGSYMRGSQAFDVEFPIAKQITKGAQCIVKMLNDLLIKTKAYITYRGFAGNHDRMNQQDKNGNITGDTSMVVVNEIVSTFLLGYDPKEKNIKFIDSEDYSAVIEDINGRNIKFVHGDLEKRADRGKIHDHSSRDGIIYDAIVYGHFHHFFVQEVGINKFEVGVGSIKGSDDYSERLGLGSAPSQAVILVDEHKEIKIERIGLD